MKTINNKKGNMEEDYIEIIEDGFCEEDGKQSDLTFWFSYYDEEKKCFVFNDAHCFVCDNELELEIGEENLNNYFNKEEVKILLEKKKEEQNDKLKELLETIKQSQNNEEEIVFTADSRRKIKKVIVVWEEVEENE